MATVSKPIRHHLATNEPSQTPEPKRRGWGRWLVGGLVLLLGVIWLTPIVVAKSPLLSWVVGSLTAEVQGKVRVESASLGWFSPIEMSGVEIHDANGQPVVEVSKLTGERWLTGLLWDSSNLGRFRAENPKLTLVLRDDGSNLEDVLHKYLSDETAEEDSKAAETGGAVGVQVEIVNGEVAIFDPRTRQSWTVQNLGVKLVVPSDASRPTVLQTAGAVTDSRRPGRFEGSLFLKQGEGKPDALTVRTENLPLALLRPVVSRLAGETRLDGWLSMTVQCQGTDLAKLDGVTVQGQANAEGFCFASPQLGTDQVAFRQLQTSGQLGWQGSRVQVDRLVVESDVGGGSAAGVVDLEGKLSDQPFEVHGQLDLARLAAMLPETLHIRTGTQVTSGQLRLSLASRPGAEGMTWQGRLDAQNLTADNQGQRFVWAQPILVDLAARQGGGGLVVDSLRCKSEFLQIEGAGTTEEFSATVNWDLNRLVGQLKGLVDFGSLQLAGDGWAKFHWKQPAGQDFLAEGQLQVQNFRLAGTEQTPWTEDKLWANLTATGRTDFSANSRLESAVLEAMAGDDRLDARLVQPIADFHNGGAWPVAVRSTGELARWLPRLSPWVSVEGVQLAGHYDLQGQVTCRSGSVYMNQSKLTVDQLQLHTTGWHVQEPRVELSADGGWDQTRQRLELRSAQATSAALAVRTQGFTLAWPETGAELAGKVEYQGRLERLQAWITDPAKPASWTLGGQLAGLFECQPSAAGFAARVDASIQNLVASDSAGQQFQEPQVRLVGQGNYQRAGGLLVVEKAELTSNTLGAVGGGQYVGQDAASLVEANGKIQYDVEKVSALMRSYLGDGIYAAGRGASPVAYRGPTTWSEGQGTAAFGWQWANLYGFEVGPGEIQAALAHGALQIRPLDLIVSEGRVRLATELRLADDPMTLVVAPGRLADQIRINPRMCGHALQYIAPVMAGVTTAEGRFSVEFDTCRIPLSEPSHGELRGRMIIHAVQIGPGPLVQELAVVLGRASPAQLNRESVIPFRLVDGRVYHENLELVFPDVTIRTYGSVGLDKTLALMAEMPVPPKWIGNNPLGTALKNQTLRLPINGTLSKPAIDRAVLNQLTQQFMQNAAGSVVQEQLNKHQDEIQRGLNKVNRELDRLFGPGR